MRGNVKVKFSSIVLDNDDVESVVTVTANVVPGSPGTMYDRNGDPGDAPSPDEVEIQHIVREDGSEIEFNSLSETTRDRLDEEAMQAYADSLEDAEADREDYEEEKARERWRADRDE